VNDDFLARSPADVKPEAGDEVGVSFAEEHVHLFDAETEEALVHGLAEPARVDTGVEAGGDAEAESDD